jgi:hypothetical protein
MNLCFRPLLHVRKTTTVKPLHFFVEATNEKPTRFFGNGCRYALPDEQIAAVMRDVHASSDSENFSGDDVQTLA